MRYISQRVTTRAQRSGSPTDNSGSAQCRFLLISGTAGVGKRSIGEYLSNMYGFRYLAYDGRQAASRGRLAAALASEMRERLVMTCSQPSAWRELLLFAPQSEWIWVDGDRGATVPSAPGADTA